MKVSFLTYMLKLTVLKKAIACRGGSIAVFSIFASIGLITPFEVLFKNISDFHLYLLALVFIFFLALYFGVWLSDLISALRAARDNHRKKINTALEQGMTFKPESVIQIDQLWTSFGKFGGVLIVKFILFAICFILLILQNITLFYVAFHLSIAIDILSVGYELHSVGVNIEKRTGKKPSFFNFLETLFTIIEEGILKKVKTIF